MATTQTQVLVVGLTPTVQRTLFLTRFEIGSVNRARTTLVTASGKAVNVARVAAALGASVYLVQILGGNAGQFVAAELEGAGITLGTVWHEDAAPTRTCTTVLVDAGPTTELVEEAQPVGDHDLQLLRAAARTALLQAGVLCCSGSLPKGVPDTFYADLIREAHTLGIPAIVDAQKGPLRQALGEKPFLVKPNREEAATTLGLPLSGQPVEDAMRAGQTLVQAGATWALVSLGKEGSLLTDGATTWRIVSPTVDVVNPIGSGDSLAAGVTVAHFVRGLSMPDAVVYGTACAAANCLTPTSGVVQPEEVERLVADVKIFQV